MSSNNDNELLSAQWSARLVVLFLGVPSLGFAVVSGLFNASYAQRLGHGGAEQATWVLASLLITCFVTGLPLAIEVLRVRVPHLAAVARGLWLGSMAFSFVAAVGYAAVTRDEATAGAGAMLRDRAGLERAIDRGEAELAALPRHRPARAVAADIRQAEADIGINCDRARSRGALEACRPVFGLRTELASADAADRIEGQLADLRARLGGVPNVGTTANPQADVLSWLGGGVLSVSVWERLLTVFIAALIELSAALGLAITARSVVELLAGPQDEPAAVQEVTPEVLGAVPLPTNVDPDTAWHMWFLRCVSPCRGGKVKFRDAFDHYGTWAALNGIPGSSLLSQTQFGQLMGAAVEASGGRIGKSSVRVYEGVALAQLGNNGVPLIGRQERQERQEPEAAE